ncbi:MAG: DEAD/DEAH box helicase [Cyanobacteria bacterium REEB459]|nr:DEAD/DEAH box helicase [Cyanobacteria bacterium REEB459]
MTILHLNWFPQEQRFWLWGEAWKPLPTEGVSPWCGVSLYPYAVTQPELAIALAACQTHLQTTGQGSACLPARLIAPAGPQATQASAKSGRRSQVASAGDPIWGTCLVHLPSHLEADRLVPIHSASTSLDSPCAPPLLHPWQVEGWWLTPGQLVPMLMALPLGPSLTAATDWIGSDLRFWGHSCRWGLNLLARGKFLPGIEVTNQTLTATWSPLIDSAIDQERLRHLALAMPLVCRSYEVCNASPLPLSCPICLTDAQILLISFLTSLIDAQVRHTPLLSPRQLANLGQELPLEAWLQALTRPRNSVQVSGSAATRLQEALTTWTTPLQRQQTDAAWQFRLRLVLQPPSPEQSRWQLVYWLQSVANPDWQISAAEIWPHPLAELYYQGIGLPAPQETLLAALGRAARFYEPLRESLRQPHPTCCQLDSLQAYAFIKASAWQLQDHGVEVELPPGLAPSGDEGQNRLGLKVQAEVPPSRQRLGLKSLLNFRWDLSLAGETLSPAEFEQLINQGSPLVQIKDRWVELRPQEVKAAQRFLQGQKTPTALSVEDALRMSTGDTQVIEKLPVVSFEASGVLQQLIDTLTTGNQALTVMAEPPGFQGTLRPYQGRGVAWLAFLEQWGLGACLADDMGLGKTVQLIAFLLHLQHQGWLETPSLLVCPTSVVGNWEKEVRRFAPGLKILVYHGDKRPRGKDLAAAIAGQALVITSYALVYRDLAALRSVPWQCLVLDEAQTIKNPDAKQSRAVRDLQGQFRIALTGTPVENRLTELWSIMDFLNPGYLGPKNFFQRRFATPIERYGDTASLKTLKALVQPFMLRRLKTDRSIIQDLPEKQEMTVFCGLSPEQARLYQQAVDAALADLDEATGLQRRGQILALLTRLKQICNHPALFLQESSLGLKGRSAKLQRLDEMVEELVAEGDRALIFTQFAEWGKLLQRHLESHLGYRALLLYGGTSKTQREAMVDRFQNDPAAPPLFILSLKAGGVGLNLTRASHVFHFDRWWNPAVENQATDRAFRIGQTRNVQVHKFVCNGTLEERIHDMIETKKGLSDQVVSEGETWLTELDTDQLRSLLLLDRQAIIDEED